MKMNKIVVYAAAICFLGQIICSVHPMEAKAMEDNTARYNAASGPEDSSNLGIKSSQENDNEMYYLPSDAENGGNPDQNGQGGQGGSNEEMPADR